MESELRKGLLMKKLKQVDLCIRHTAKEETGMECEKDELGPLTSSSDKINRQKGSSANATDFLPTWNEYFDSNVIISLPERGHRFNTYFTMPTNTKVNSIPIFIFHHGAGSSALTFAPLIKELAARLDGACGALSMDARGHGLTKPTDDQQALDYTLEAFVNDLNVMTEHFYDHKLQDCVPQEKLSIIFLGHSLGGSICTSVYNKLRSDIKDKVVGIGMFDIVEEAAIAALKKMDNFLYTTPNAFPNVNDAIEYHVAHGLSNLRSSAAISVPSLFRQDSDGSVVRVTNLSSFKPFWHTWFDGLSHDFVKLPISKLLVLAGSDNLDRELIIGQMQGKYQLVVFQESGHFIQEDAPTKAAFTLVDFWRRNDTKNYVLKTNWSSKD